MAIARVLSRYFARSLLVLLTLVALAGVGDAAGAQLTVSWTDSSNGLVTTRLERRLLNETAFTALVDLPPGVTTYVDSSVSGGATYCYRAFAYTAGRVSQYSNEACGTASAAVSYASITVSKGGTGAGTVVSTPAGINCGTTCSMAYLPGLAITLSTTPATGSVFSGWGGGACTGSGSCVIASNTQVAVTATFSVTTSSLTVTPSAGPVGTQFAVTLTYAGGSTMDWLTIAPAGAANSTYGAWTYVSSLSGTGTKTWKVTLTTPGTFEARLFLNDGFTRAATSPRFTVLAAPTLSVAATGGSGGKEFIVTLSNWSGGSLDWLTIVPVGVTNTVYGPWVYAGSLPGTGGTRYWRVTLRGAGLMEARLLLNDGFTRAATSPTFTVP